MTGGWWMAITSAVATLLFAVRRALLGAPTEARGVPRATAHGDFGADRGDHLHQGVDLAATPGSHVLAVGDGVIVSNQPGRGKVVRKLRLDRPGWWPGGAETIDSIVYADLGVPLVEPGDRVRRGDPIALVGASGFVHVAVKKRRGPVESFIDPQRAGFVYRRSSEVV